MDVTISMLLAPPLSRCPERVSAWPAEGTVFPVNHMILSGAEGGSLQVRLQGVFLY